MPESKHRRGGKNRPRAHQTSAPEVNAKASPAWVPIVGVALLIVGVLVILIGYLPGVSSWLGSLPGLGSNWGLVGGFILLSVGFGFLTQWR
jgi:hypothetical protein